MKILSFVATCLLAVAANAAAPSIPASERIVLNSVTVDGKLNPTHVAVVNLNHAKNSIAVTVYDDMCGQYRDLPPGTVRCMGMAFPVAQLEVPIQNIHGGCGSIYYAGSNNQLPVDGPLTVINAIDHRLRMCEDVVESSFILDASVTNAWTNQTTTYHMLK